MQGIGRRDPQAAPGRPAAARRWVQLLAGLVCMVTIANLQYGWTLFVHPLRVAHGWDRSAIQVAFTLFILAETWLLPLEGWIVDRFGPRRVVLAGGVLIAAAWSVNAVATSLLQLYVGAILGGIGAGAVFGTCIANSLKWFPDRRGLAAGLTAAGYGMGSALTVVPIQHTIETAGYAAAFLWFGIGQGIVVCIAGLVLAAPAPDAPLPVPAQGPPAANRRPSELLRSPLFWALYAIFVLVGSGGLVFTAQLAPMARDMGVAGVPVTLLGLTLPALTFALTLDRATNGLTRPLCGWISDRIGREPTMFVAFALEAVGIWALARWGHDPLAFVLLGGLVFFAWGEVSSLLPAACADYFGPRHATANVGLLYTAKGLGSLLVPLASLLAAAAGSWQPVLHVIAVMNVAAALLALAALPALKVRLANGAARAGAA